MEKNRVLNQSLSPSLFAPGAQAFASEYHCGNVPYDFVQCNYGSSFYLATGNTIIRHCQEAETASVFFVFNCNIELYLLYPVVPSAVGADDCCLLITW